MYHIPTKRAHTFTSAGQLALGLLLLLASGHVRYYVHDIPHTMQTLAIVCIALCYPRKTAIKTTVLYAVVATLGPTAMTMSAGLTGATAGYFIGFLCATHIITSQKAHTQTTIATILTAQMAIWGCGMVYLSCIIGPEKAFWLGVYPFVITDCCKSIIAWSLIRHFKIGQMSQ